MMETRISLSLSKALFLKYLQVLKEIEPKLVKIEPTGEGLFLKAWSSNYISLFVPVEEPVEMESAMVEFRDLYRAVKSMGKELSIAIDGLVRISDGKKEDYLVRSYLEFEEPETSFSISIDAKVFGKAITQTSFAMPLPIDKKSYFKGLSIKKEGKDTVFSATNGHRLALVRTDIEWFDDRKIAIPQPVVLSLRKFFENFQVDICSAGIVEVRNIFGYKVGENLCLRFGSNVFVFPPADWSFNVIIPQSYNFKLVVDRIELLDILKSFVKRYDTRKKPVPVKFALSSKLELTTEDKKSYAVLPAVCYGGDFSIWINALYLVDALEAFDCKRVAFFMTAKDEVVKVISAEEKDQLLYLVMPMNIE